MQCLWAAIHPESDLEATPGYAFPEEQRDNEEVESEPHHGQAGIRVKCRRLHERRQEPQGWDRIRRHERGGAGGRTGRGWWFRAAKGRPYRS